MLNRPLCSLASAQRPPSKPLLHARRHCPQVVVHLPGRLAEDQAHDRLARNVDVLEAAEDVDLGVCEDDARLAGIFNSEFRLSVLACCWMKIRC